MFRLLCGPARSGKTSRLVTSFLTSYEQNPLADDLLILAPGNVAVEELRRRIAEQNRRHGLMGKRVYTLLAAARACLTPGASPACELSRADRIMLVQEMCAHFAAEGRLAAFKHMLPHAGFFESLAALVTELREARLDPQELRRAGKRLGNTAEQQRCESLASIAEEYANLCRLRGLVDREEIFSLAIKRLADGAAMSWRPLRHLLIDGFYDFNPLQWSFVEALIARAEQVTATLLYEKDRPQLYGPQRSGLVQRQFERFAALADEVVWLSVEEASNRIAEPLGAIERGLFEPIEPVIVEADGSVEIISGGDEASAAAALVAACKRLIRQGACQAEGVGIVVRQLGARRRALCQALQAHGVPYVCRDAESLAEQNVARFCERALRLLTDDWPADLVLDVMTNPYCLLRPGRSRRLREDGAEDGAGDALTRAEQHARLRATVVECGISGGLADWRRRLREREIYLRERCAAKDDAAADRAPFETVETPTHRLARHQETAATFERIFACAEEAPRQGHATALAAGLIGYIEALGVEEAIESADDDLRHRDLRALHAWRDEVKGAAAQITAFRGTPEVDLPTFARCLQQRLAECQAPLTPQEAGAVFVCDANTARQRHFDVVAIGGLEAHGFPLTVRQSALMPDALRGRLNRHLGGERLEMSQTRQQEERLLFYHCVTRANQRLLLGYACEDESNPASGRSQYVAEIERLVSVPPKARDHRPAAGVVLSPASLWRAADLRIAAFAQLPRSPMPLPAIQEGHGGSGSALHPELFALPSPLLDSEDGDELQRLLAAVAVERRRLDMTTHGRWSGLLDASAVRASLATEFGEVCWLSATALTDYGKCPFRYFSNQILKLRSASAAAEPLSRMEEGDLEHRILEQFFRAEASAGRLPISRDEEDAAIERLRGIARHLFRRFERERLPMDQARWEAEQREIVQVLIEFLRADAARCAERSDGSRIAPSHFELAFGRRGGAIHSITEHATPSEGESGPESVATLSFQMETTTVHLRGVIDRIDYLYETDAAGQPVLTGFQVLDYKLSRDYDKLDYIERGITFQLPFYLWAARSLIPHVPALAAGYMLLRGKKHAPRLYMKPTDDQQSWPDDALEQTKSHIALHLKNIQQGNFALSPILCEEACPFRSACRINAVKPASDETEVPHES